MIEFQLTAVAVSNFEVESMRCGQTYTMYPKRDADAPPPERICVSRLLWSLLFYLIILLFLTFS
uniref:Uncharacterized protein n=1 Tax=Lepeophtheirus salmonis TaxID=72036 RepID=A0A0K2V2A2_LEPSM